MESRHYRCFEVNQCLIISRKLKYGDFALYFSEINVAWKAMHAFIQLTVRQHLRKKTDRQHLFSEARLKLKLSSLWGRAKKKKIKFKLNFVQSIYMIDIVYLKFVRLDFEFTNGQTLLNIKVHHGRTPTGASQGTWFVCHRSLFELNWYHCVSSPVTAQKKSGNNGGNHTRSPISDFSHVKYI